MSLLDTIELQGIRSVGVGPENVNVIEFLSPLTIICGPNGAGKTTIIEALKYVTTGELPKGSFQAFIHDMRLAGKNRVDASVKLKFKDIRGRPCVVTRRMMQSQGAKGKVTNRSEESTIAIEKEPGEWKSLSSKVVDCKKEILNLLGLPAAILDYVVFCHQEESSWPLDEPKKLKERFDEIFQVTGYVKAIEVLKKELKENQQELKVTEGRLPLLIRQQEEKMELYNEYNVLKERIEDNEKEISSKQEVLKEQIAKKNEKAAELDEAETLSKKRDMVETEKQILVDQIKCCTAVDYEGGIEDLKREIDLMASSKEFIDVERDRLRIEKQIEEVDAEVKDYLAKKDGISEAIVQLKSIQMMRDKMAAERKQCLDQCFMKFGLKCQQFEVLKELQDLIVKRKEQMNSFKMKLDEKQHFCQKQIDSVSENLAQIAAKIDMKSEECKRLEKEIATTEGSIMKAANSSQKSNVLQDEIRELEKVLQSMQSTDEAESKIENLKKERDNVANKIEILRREYQAREFSEEIENKIKQRNDELSKFEKEFSELNDKHRIAFVTLFNTETPEFPLCERLTFHARKIAHSLSETDEEYKIHEKELLRTQTAVSQLNRELDQLTDQIASYKHKIMKVVPHESEAETRLNEIRTLLKKSRQDLGRIDGCSFFLEQWEEEVAVRKCCPLCERSCSSVLDSDSLKEKIKQKKKDLPKEAEKLMRKTKDYEELQNELTEIIPYIEMLKESNIKIKQLRENLNKAEEKLREQDEEFSKSKTERDAIMEKQNVLRDIQVDASLMDSIWKSLSFARQDIKLLEAKVIDGDKKRSLNDLRTELKECDVRFKDLISELDNAQNVASEKNKVVVKLNELRERRAALDVSAVQSESLKKSLNSMKKELERCNGNVIELKTQKPVIEQLLLDKREQRIAIQNEYRKEEAELLSFLREVEDAAKDLERLEEKLRDFDDNTNKIKIQEDQFANVEAMIDEGSAKIRELVAQLDHLNSKQECKRRLEDQLRKLELRKRIDILDEHLKGAEWHGAPISELRTDFNSLTNSVNNLQLMIENKKGELNEQKNRLTAMKRNLDSPAYSQSKEELKKEVIKKRVTTRVIEDLTNYIRVVDDSVVKFHAQKMEEVNEVLASLWEQVYHGHDVETIQIKSESADDKEKKKSYNYRVVMSVGGTEFDMPGRCSAGQKMLASILIRIALSDVFCDRCSIIALDEPTTNLDVLKVENLGDMLADIVRARCASNAKAFQLIVITHDNRFVDHLRQLCCPEWVYAVSKDNLGLSRIKRHQNFEDAEMREE